MQVIFNKGFSNFHANALINAASHLGNIDEAFPD
jgi:hypothetical protein